EYNRHGRAKIAREREARVQRGSTPVTRHRLRFDRLPLERILLALGSTKTFDTSPIGLGGDAAGTGILPEQRDGLVVEGFDASASSPWPTAIAGGDCHSSAELL